MKKIIDYKILEAGTTQHMTTLVMENINYGWQPYGFLTPNNDGNGGFTQVVVKYQSAGTEQD